MKKLFVEFYSPGTFVSETTKKEIEKEDVQLAVKMSKKISERHGAKPYGFRFVTYSRKSNELDSKQTKASGMYYLGGKVMTLEQVKAKKDPKDKILISNMEGNGFKRIIENCNSYKITLPLNDEDVVLDMEKYS